MPAGPLDNLEEAIRKLQDMYDDPDIVIPASQLPEKENPYKDFEDRNPMAGGGQIIGKPGGVVEPGVMYYGRRVISGVTDGVELAKPKDGKKFQLRVKGSPITGFKDQTYLFKTEKQLVDFFNKNIKKGSGAQKTTLDKKGEEFKKFFKDKKIYSRYYDGPLNASSIDKIWLSLTAGQKQQAELAFKTKNKNIKEAADLTKKGYIQLDDLAEKLGRSSGIELMKSMENPGSKFKETFPNFLEKPGNVVKSTNRNTWIKITPSSLKKLKTWADSDSRKGLKPKTIANVQAAYKNDELMNYWKKWKVGTPIDQALVDSVHGAKGSATTMMQLARTLQGKESIDGVRKNVALGNKIMEAVRYKAKEFGDWHTAAYQYAKQDMDNFIPVGKSGNTFNDYYKMLTKSLKEAGLKGFSIDEINALRAGVKGGTQPYSVFSQVLETKYNTGIKRRFDAQNSQNQSKLSRALAMGDNETIKVAHRRSDFPKVMNKNQYINYVITLQNEQVDNFFKKIPELKDKISLPKFDLRDPRTVYGARFNTFDPAIQNAILKNFKEVGYTVDVGKKALTQKELLKKLMGDLAGTVNKTCIIRKTKADGGRIGFFSGSPDCDKLSKQLVQKAIKGEGTTQQRSIVNKLIRGGANFLKSAVDPVELLKLRNYVGPQALGFISAYEAGVIADDVLRMGKPLNEAVASNWLTKSFLPYTEEFAKQENLLKSGTLTGEQRLFALDAMKYNKLLKEVERIEGMEATQLTDQGGMGMIDGTPMVSQAEIDKAMANVTRVAETIDPSVLDPRSAKAIENKTKMDEMIATRRAKKNFSSIFGSPRLKNRAENVDTGDYLPDSLKIDLSPITYKNAEDFKPVTELPANRRIALENLLLPKDQYMPMDRSLSNFQYKGSNKTVLEDELEEYNRSQKFKEAFQQPGILGANEKFATGGRAGFKGGTPQSVLRKGVLSLIEEGVKKTPKDTTSALDKLIKKTLDEDLFDKKDRIIDQINISEAKKRKNYPYNQQVFEEPKNLDFYDAITKSNFRTKTGPYYDRIRKNKAGGGLLKQAGDRSGPPPESGPNSQGLQGLLNRVKKV